MHRRLALKIKKKYSDEDCKTMFDAFRKGAAKVIFLFVFKTSFVASL